MTRRWRAVRQNPVAPHIRSMTTDSAAVRPYSVFVRVPDAGFDNSVRIYTHVDRGLTPSELDSVSSPSDIRKLELTSLLDTSLTPVVVIALAAWGFTQWGMDSAAGATAWWVVTVAVVAAIVWAYCTKGRIMHRVGRLTGELIEAGRLANPHARRSDLRRIEAALTVLQASSGTAYDDLARQAVIAVLDQDLRAPTAKTVAIAESKAVDPASVVIRARVLAQKAQHNADIAKAESLVFDLEQYAAQKKAEESVTAG